MNQSYASVNAPYATLTPTYCVQSANVQKIMQLRYFRVFLVSSIQIGYSMRVVHAECMNIV